MYLCILTSFPIVLGRNLQTFSTVEIISCYENKRMKTHTCTCKKQYKTGTKVGYQYLNLRGQKQMNIFEPSFK